jgi:hypothetical protein
MQGETTICMQNQFKRLLGTNTIHFALARHRAQRTAQETLLTLIAFD